MNHSDDHDGLANDAIVYSVGSVRDAARVVPKLRPSLSNKGAISQGRKNPVKPSHEAGRGAWAELFDSARLDFVQVLDRPLSQAEISHPRPGFWP